MGQPDFDKEREAAAREGMPGEPFTAMSSMAAEMHEAFETWTQMGFSEMQAIYLVGCLLTGCPGKIPND